MSDSWAAAETATVDLSDKRLNDRLRAVLSQLGARPTASIPEACGGRAETTAAYRLFDHEAATFAAILAAHQEATDRRLAAQPTAILVQDTTEIDLTRRTVVGAGPLDDARHGALLHVLHAFTPDGTPLGTAAAQPWTRAAGERSSPEVKSFEERESFRWVNTLRLAQQTAARAPATRCVCAADSEADVYEVFAAAAAAPEVDWIVRGRQNRALLAADAPATLLHEHVAARPELFRRTLAVGRRTAKIACETRARRNTRPAREAEVAVRAARVTLRPPQRVGRKLAPATVNAVLVRELQPPDGADPVEWLLLTGLPIDDAEQVRRVIEYYCARWMIEVFFRVLKSGCRVEERRFETLDRLLSCLAVYLIVAWRTLYVCRLGRSCPELDCEALFEPAEWKATWKIVRRSDPPAKPPKLSVMVKLVARLGGYVERPNSPPGPQTLWLGLQRVHDFALCWEQFGPEARPPTKRLV